MARDKNEGLAIKQCRGCGSLNSINILYDFGEQPVAGYLVKEYTVAKEPNRISNSIAICNSCGLVQQAFDDAVQILIDTVYSDYQPTYSMSQKVRDYLESFLDLAVNLAGLEKGDYVVEVGSNDGSMLEMIEKMGFLPVGFDPSAASFLDGYPSKGIMISDFFSSKAASDFVETHGQVKLLLTRHTLEHVFEPKDFLEGIENILSPSGVAVIEVPYLWAQMMNNQFQSMGVQHVSFFTVSSLLNIIEDIGLGLIDVKYAETDAGSMIVYVDKKRGNKKSTDTVIGDVLLEKAFKLDKPDGYVEYFREFDNKRKSFKTFIKDAVEKGINVVAYGAGGKGQALLNVLGLDDKIIKYVIDDTDTYEGRFIPGVGTEVISSKDYRADSANVILVTAPSHVKEILEKERSRFEKGIKFISTVPDYHYVLREDVI